MTIRTIDPSTGKPLAEHEELSAAGIAQALDRATRAYEAWRRVPIEERAERLRRVASLLHEQADAHAELMTREMGKPISQARSETEKCAWVCQYYAEHAETFLAPKEIETDAKRSYVRFDPLGPVLAVMPWNFPYWQVFRFAAPALMAGNVGLLKHASNVPGCSQAIAKLFEDAGCERGVFQSLLVPSAAIGGILESDAVRAVTLTGSEKAGAEVAAHAGRCLKKQVLELGGSDPFVVLDDVDVAKVAGEAAKARTINSGQSCIAAKRFIVHARIADEFTEAFGAALEALRVGDPMDAETDVGPLAREDLLEDLDRVVERSVAAGARLVTGGQRIDRPGFYYPPTLLADVRPGMPAADEETFGPVAAVIVAKDDADAVRIANESRYGLGASVWSADVARAERLVPDFECGHVAVGGIVKSDPRLPFGGVKRSGYGRELSAFGIREFVNVKAVWVGG